ncbi:MAG: bifunctional UDP-N-acetylmuramoyl-tripeptide:D-alanyl-D-alanine ligase/alanine racemase [Paludibacteraceae bacterium]|nr:bifunctional UDP-N-acetylmuramoyl-tripeptide:D-alanyl-D-alanine ligase/alanine racemase [Paludibacteraceae bacterium]
MNINEIAQIIGASNTRTEQKGIKWLLTDSRSLSFPDTSLFFALRTQRNDGHKYISELYESGVRSFVVESLPQKAEKMSQASFLVVENTLVALQKLATYHRAQHTLPVIGITGSNGKTIVKEWLFQLLNHQYNIERSPRSYNSQIGVPLSVWQLNPNTQLAIFEAGISQPGEMQYLQPIIEPTIGIFTNIGDAHQENFSSLEEKVKEKMKLFKNCSLLIYNKDEELIDDYLQNTQIKTFTWGTHPHANIHIRNIKKIDNKTCIEYNYQNKDYSYILPFTDAAAIENSLHCITLMLHLNYTPESIQESMMQLQPIAMRLEVKDGIQNNLIINDSYNADLTSLAIALDFLDQQATAKRLTKTVVLSDIMQSGHNNAELHNAIADMLRSRKINRLIGIGHVLKENQMAFSGMETSFYNTTQDYIASGDYRMLKNAVILLKGSRLFSLEQLAKHLEITTHETVLEVNLSALAHNFNHFRSKLNPKTKIMCMVKAFAYGTGAVEVARTLQHHRCDYLAVAVADEGAELRRAGIHTPIVVMDPEMNALDSIIENELEPNIYNFRILQAFSDAVKSQGLSHYPVHIKIDSGMHRLGFSKEEMPILTNLLASQSTMAVRSAFSHLAGSDDPQFDDFTLRQINTFTQCANELQQALTYPIMRHILNSAGIERFTEHQLDMVRLGIGHYGISALPDTQLKNVCTLKTVILQTKHVKAGESVGYSRKAMLTEDKQIAIIPIGYADGFHRKLGNGVGQVLINGQRCPVIGNICMDQAMIDITHANAKEGDEVIIFGEEISLNEIATKLDTISYEILTGVSRRVKRIYYQE